MCNGPFLINSHDGTIPRTRMLLDLPSTALQFRFEKVVIVLHGSLTQLLCTNLLCNI